MQASDARALLTSERQRLYGLRQQTAAALEESREGDRAELSRHDQHAADAATELHDMEVDESLVATLDAELDEVDDALRRVDDGTYGRCEQCGQPVADERLEAMPTARFCAEHEPPARA
jgi:RNA polymerase-binding transcription factor DksA